MIEITVSIFVIIMCVFFIILIIKIVRAEQKITDINNNFSLITKNIQDFYSKNLSFITQTSHDNQNLIEIVNQKVLRLEQTNSKILAIVDTIEKLEDVFLNSKKRGIWGEKNLEALISDFLPSYKFQAQYKTKSGYIVDFVIFFEKYILPIDAKFPLENYLIDDFKSNNDLIKSFARAVKMHIDEVSKYVEIEENPFGIAFLYLPAEGVYSFVLSDTKLNITFNVLEYATRKNVILVSPNTFIPYLNFFLKYFVRQNISNEFDLIYNELQTIIKAFDKINEYLSKTIKLNEGVYQNLVTIKKSIDSVVMSAEEIKKLRQKI